MATEIAPILSRLTGAHPGHGPVVDILNRAGLRAWHLHTLSLGAVALCLGLWVRAKTVDQEQRGNAERRALFVGLWPPTLYLIGDSLERRQSAEQPVARRLLRR